MEKKRILVVDDEPQFLELIKIRLEANDYEVVIANNGQEALDMLKETKLDAVLLDILMPDIDGLEVLKRIRKNDKDLPVFMISAFFNQERFQLANKHNASGFIVKTNDLKKEVKNITSVLRMADKYKAKKAKGEHRDE